jgi:nitronate monooxygenase
MAISTAVTQLLRIEHPILQAPMAGGGDTPELIAAVCAAGGFGSIGGAYLTPQAITEAAREIRSSTDRPFGVNLFAPVPVPDIPAETSAAIDKVAPHFQNLGLERPSTPASGGFSFDDQLSAALETGASAFSFTFGIMPEEVIGAAKSRNMTVLGTATNVREAVELQAAGVDAIVAQSAEAGGHRGTFSGDFDAGMIGAISLVPQIADAVRVPVIASGGIMDGRGLAAALTLGAGAVQFGTAFLTTPEAGIPKSYKEAIMKAEENATRLTRAFSGRPARGIQNEFLCSYEGAAADDILPFPFQNALTRPMRAAAAKQGRAEYLSLWAGQGLRLSRELAAGDLVRKIAAEAEEAFHRIAAMTGR